MATLISIELLGSLTVPALASQLPLAWHSCTAIPSPASTNSLAVVLARKIRQYIPPIACWRRSRTWLHRRRRSSTWTRDHARRRRRCRSSAASAWSSKQDVLGLLEGCVIGHDDPEVCLFVELKPAHGDVVGISCSILTNELLEPSLFLPSASSSFTNGEWKVVGCGVRVVEFLVELGEESVAAHIISSPGITINANNIHSLRSGPPGRKVLDSGLVGTPEAFHLFVAGAIRGMDVLPRGNEVGGSTVICAVDYIPVHLVREAEPDFDPGIGELFHHRRDLLGDGGGDLVEVYGRHDGGDEDGPGGYDIGFNSKKLGAVEAGGGDLRVPAVGARLGTEFVGDLGHGVSR
jgi:hypothetical protein